MLIRLRQWWNRPDPMTAIILWQMDQTMEWVNKWHDKRNWSRLWKQTAKFWYSGDGCTQRYNEWVILSRDLREDIQADADRRLELLKRVNTMWQGGLTEEQGRKLCDELREELADAK